MAGHFRTDPCTCCTLMYDLTVEEIAGSNPVTASSVLRSLVSAPPT